MSVALECELLTVEEVAGRLRQSVQTVRRKIALGQLDAVRLGEHGPLRVPVDALDSHLRPVGADGSPTEGARRV
jgi:excisionase family DNA binding protein